MKSSPIIRKAQAGFTLIELIVVIVILGILAATALPRMFDMSGQARLAKMQGALGAVRAANSAAHAQWLVSGGLVGCKGCGTGGTDVAGTTVMAEGKEIKMVGGYPDVGGDAHLDTATVAADSGIIQAAGLSSDYVVSTIDSPSGGTTATKNIVVVSADAAHPKCRFKYKEAVISTIVVGTTPTVTEPPVIDSSELIPTNCG